MSSLWMLALAALVLAAVVAIAGLLVRGRQSAEARAALASAVERLSSQPGAATAPPSGTSWWSTVADHIAPLGRRLQKGRLEEILLAAEDRVLLDQAGWGHSAAQSTFIGLRACLALLLPLLVLLLVDADGTQLLMLLLAAAAFGLLLPKFVLQWWAGRLRKAVHDELPLFIDLLRLLQSVGFSIDQSLQMLGDKLRPALPVIGYELHVANQAYSRGRSREMSLQRLSDTFANEDLRALIQMIVQVHSHGGAVQEPLKQFGLRLREKRRMEMKEKVGKLSVKMTVVMMLTLLPALMLTLAGPALVSLARTMSQMGNL